MKYLIPATSDVPGTAKNKRKLNGMIMCLFMGGILLAARGSAAHNSRYTCKNCTPHTATAQSYRGSDILVKPEQIRWIILVLQFDQPIVVRTKCFPFPTLAF